MWLEKSFFFGYPILDLKSVLMTSTNSTKGYDWTLIEKVAKVCCKHKVNLNLNVLFFYLFIHQTTLDIFFLHTAYKNNFSLWFPRAVG